MVKCFFKYQNVFASMKQAEASNVEKEKKETRKVGEPIRNQKKKFKWESYECF